MMRNLLDEAVKLQHECSEYISDTFWSIFAGGWADVPAHLKKCFDVRFKSPAQRAEIFKVTN